MAFTVPSFPLAVNGWYAPHIFPAVPDMTCVGNLALGKRIYNATFNGSDISLTPVLLCPKGTDLRSALKSAGHSMAVEVPAGTGRYYTVIDVEDVGKGFPNEFRIASLIAFANWPIPYP